MNLHATVPVLWPGATVVVAATGPSLLMDDLHLLRGHKVVIVNDAYRYIPAADVLYSCDGIWWRAHDGVRHFGGRRFTSHDVRTNDKVQCAEEFDLEVVHGRPCANDGFSFNSEFINYGDNSGFQAINLAILAGAKRVIMIGFDLQRTGGMDHCFGLHKFEKFSRDPERFIPEFNRASLKLSALGWPVQIINATVETKLACFPRMRLADALCLEDYVPSAHVVQQYVNGSHILSEILSINLNG